MQLLAMAVALVVPTAMAKNASSPWCRNASAPAIPGMYGDIGPGIGFVGPERHGVFVDVPLDVAPIFSQGLAHFWGFNVPESCRNFETAVALNPACALCHWGVVACNSPNLQLHTSPAQQKIVNQAAATAHALAQNQTLTAKSMRLIEAAMTLVGDEPDEPPYNVRKRYAKAMCAPMPGDNGDGAAGDPDIDALCGGALMSTSPWDYYQGVPAGGTYPLKPEMVDAKDRLLATVTRGRHGGPHPLAIHYLIHLLEPTNAPASYRQEALPWALALYGGGRAKGDELVPSQGHLTHMPAHLFLRVGLYHQAVLTSIAAATNNARYVDNCLTPYVFFHNLHMLVAGAILGGERGVALEYSKALRNYSDGTPVWDPLEANIYAAFGMWSALERMPPPAATAGRREASSVHYGKALAHYARGDAKAGDAEAALSRKAAAASMTKRIDVAIGFELTAVRAWRIDRDAPSAIAAYEKEIAEIDSWAYYEPPGEFHTWYYSVRRCLGAVYLADTPHRNATAALEMYTRDLATFVNNSWSLVGAAQSLGMLGRKVEAAQMAAWAKIAWNHSDVPLPVSPCPQLAYD